MGLNRGSFLLTASSVSSSPELPAGSALDLIGETPLLSLDRIHPGPGRILAKAEFLQPGGSVKDRAAKAILLAAIADGRLKPGMPVVEMTSGNMGAGLAVACAALGHPLIVTMSAGNSVARARMLRALGADVILVDQVEGRAGQVTGRDIETAESVARQIAEERDGFYVDQFNASEGTAAHEQGTAQEILRQSGVRIDGWVAAVGTGATFMGVARALNAANPATVCAAVEPARSRPLANEVVAEPAHLIQGTGYGFVPPQWDPTLMDLSIGVSDKETAHWRQKLGAVEGLYVGFSAAANVCAAVRLLSSGLVKSDGVIATVLCDTGLKY
ncbi:MAG TPA: cysteine synthase family protein [Sphingomicrobium sp.]|nr:cysteine synthase family protein [Sphingomicrobium sp.]